MIACLAASHWGGNVIRNFHDLGVLAYVYDPESRARNRIIVREKAARTKVCAAPPMGIGGVLPGSDWKGDVDLPLVSRFDEDECWTEWLRREVRCDGS